MAELLTESEWRERRRMHEDRVDLWITPYLQRRSRGVAHPVDDFLFTYYTHSPAALRRWRPGLNVVLTGPQVDEFAWVNGYAVHDGRLTVDPQVLVDSAERASWIRTLLVATAGRPPTLGCLGLHEWAMVYRQSADDVRHSGYPLRLGSHGTDEVVESQRITCTHFDAFRFFTAPARPFNAVQPSRDTQPLHDQPGCLHAAMDCYKWAYQLAPLTASELVADCFELARDVRQVDMRASPYDLGSLGIDAIPIETVAGKATYIAYQRAFAERSNRLRGRLTSICDAALSADAIARRVPCLEPSPQEARLSGRLSGAPGPSSASTPQLAPGSTPPHQ